MHPYFVATVVVSVVVVGFVAYTVYNEILNEPIPVYSTAGSNKYDSKDSDSNSENDSDSDLSSKNVTEERIGLKRRKKGTRSINEKHSEDQEEQLLEKLSYLNILEQELHRRGKEIENEEQILKEREQELENRKLHLQSISSKSSSNSDLSKNTDTPHTANTQANTSSTNTILDNDSSDENSLINIAVAVKDVVERHPLNNENSFYPDTVAQTILSQDLLNINSHHLQSSINDAYNKNDIIITNEGNYNNNNDRESNSSIINDDEITHTQQQLHVLRETPHIPDNLSPNQSEDAWSEIGSIISEDIGSEMSSAVDIDMEEVDVIEH